VLDAWTMKGIHNVAGASCSGSWPKTPPARRGRAGGMWIRPDGCYQANARFSLYRWHIMDPVRFKQDLGVTIPSLGWRAAGRYLPNQDDMASTAFWYQAEPHAAFPVLPDRDGLEII